MARPRKPSKELGSLEDCSEALHRVLLLTLQLEGLQADRDREVAGAQARYEGAIDKAVGEKTDLEEQLQQYYMTHLRDVEKDGRKSVQLYWGVLGRRLGHPALKLLNRSWTWAVVQVKLRQKFGDRFLRLRDPEVDKDLVKAELAGTEDLKECGMRVDQEEKFFAEPDRARAVEV